MLAACVFDTRVGAAVRGIGCGVTVFGAGLLVCAGRCPDRGRRCAMLLPHEPITHVHHGSIPEDAVLSRLT